MAHRERRARERLQHLHVDSVLAHARWASTVHVSHDGPTAIERRQREAATLAAHADLFAEEPADTPGRHGRGDRADHRRLADAGPTRQQEGDGGGSLRRLDVDALDTRGDSDDRPRREGDARSHGGHAVKRRART